MNSKELARFDSFLQPCEDGLEWLETCRSFKRAYETASIHRLMWAIYALWDNSWFEPSEINYIYDRWRFHRNRSRPSVVERYRKLIHKKVPWRKVRERLIELEIIKVQRRSRVATRRRKRAR
jgi:hypothetical protein